MMPKYYIYVYLFIVSLVLHVACVFRQSHASSDMLTNSEDKHQKEIKRAEEIV